jgi:hypothetical protein
VHLQNEKEKTIGNLKKIVFWLMLGLRRNAKQQRKL